MAYVRKYLVGERLTFHEAVNEVLLGNYIFCNHKAMHPGWCIGWSLLLFRSFANGGSLRRANVNPEWKPRKQDQDHE